jgi:membrane protein XagC
MASVSTWLPNVKRRSRNKTRSPHSSPVFLVVLLLLALLCSHLLTNGYLSSDALARYAKLLVMRDASGLRLEYAGFLSPQVSLYLSFFFSSLLGVRGAYAPYLVDIVAVSLFAALVWRDLAKNHGQIWAWLWIALLVLHPFLLWTATSGRDLGLGLLAVYCLARTLPELQNDPEPLAYLRFAGWLTLLFLVDGRAGFIALAFLPWLALVTPVPLLKRAPVAFYLICYMPFVFAVLSWMYLNWLYHGSSLLFMQQADSAFRGGYAQALQLPWLLEFGGTLWLPLLWLALAGLMSSPSLLLTPWGRRRAAWAVPVATAGALVCAGAIATYLWYTAHPVDFLVLLLVPVALGLRDVIAPNKVPVSVALVLGILLGWAVLLRIPMQEIQQWTTAIQDDIDLLPNEEMELGSWLAGSRLPTLIDDQAAYAAIAARRDAVGLILPFSDEFKLALASPDRLPAQIVVPAPGSRQGAQDAITQRFPDIWQNGRPGYRLVYEQEVWRVWQQQ